MQYEGGKFSKSRNIGVFGDKAGEIGVPASVWRYYLLANRPETSDSQFAWRDFITRNNSELLSNLGNFCNRVLTFMKKYEFTLPSCSLVPEGELSEEGDSPRAIFVRDVNAILAQYIDSMENVKLRNGLQAMMALSARGNLFLTESGLDNTLFTTKREECDVVMLLAANLIWTLSALVHPFMPDTADAILAQLDAPPRTVPARGKFSIDLLPGHRIGKAAHLFKQIDPKMEEVWRNQFGGSKDSKAGDAAGAAGAAPVSKRQAQKAAKAAKKAAQPSTATVKEKTPEMLALEEKVKEQAEVVRKAKEAAKAGAQAGEVDKEVAALLKLKCVSGDGFRFPLFLALICGDTHFSEKRILTSPKHLLPVPILSLCDANARAWHHRNELTEVTDKLAKLEVDGQAPGGAP